MLFYVYTLSRPDSRVFYVGKGRGTRIYAHEAEARNGHNCHKCHLIRKIWQSGDQVIKRVIYQTMDEAAAYAEEDRLIRTLGLKTLTNKIEGHPGRSGYNHSPETRAKIAASNSGKVFTEERRRNIGNSRRGRPITKPRSPETLARLSAALKGRVLSEEHKEKLRGNRANTGRVFSAEHRAKIAESNRRTKERTRHEREAARLGSSMETSSLHGV